MTENAMAAKAWSDMTEKEINALKLRQCCRCHYFSRESDSLATRTCEYIDKEGHSRGCSPLVCKEMGIYRPRVRRRRNV